MIEIKYNIDFKRILKEFETQRLTKTLNEGVSPEVAGASAKYIKSGHVIPKLKKTNPRGTSAPPLFDTGKLANSLRGGPSGISGGSYGKKHYQEGGYTWDKKVVIKGKEKTLHLEVPQRKFITADYPSEKTANKKIYKEFEKKFIKLLKSRLRK